MTPAHNEASDGGKPIARSRARVAPQAPFEATRRSLGAHGRVLAVQDAHRALRPEGLAVGISGGHNGDWSPAKRIRIDAALQALGWQV